MSQIKMADALMCTAEAVVALGKKAGMTVSITKLYGKEQIKDLALTTKFLMELVNTASTTATQIEVVRE